MPQGYVSLVGAGPGDPELITLKGLKRIRGADLIVHDRLIADELLEESRGARLRYAGKQPEGPSASQEDIHDLLIEAARVGDRVVRLKGGDPCIFGRGGEEARALSRAGIPFEIVPGVTSAIGVPTSRGIPLTHRDYASSVAILTGHRKKDAAERLKWKELARGADTLVLLMSVKTMERNFQWIMDVGRDPGTPAAALGNGTLGDEHYIEGTLATLPEKARTQGLSPPATIVVGEVVSVIENAASYTQLRNVVAT